MPIKKEVNKNADPAKEKSEIQVRSLSAILIYDGNHMNSICTNGISHIAFILDPLNLFTIRA